MSGSGAGSDRSFRHFSLNSSLADRMDIVLNRSGLSQSTLASCAASTQRLVLSCGDCFPGELCRLQPLATAIQTARCAEGAPDMTSKTAIMTIGQPAEGTDSTHSSFWRRSNQPSG